MKVLYTTYFITLLTLYKFVNLVYSKSDVQVGYRFTLDIPPDYTEGFSGRAYLMETDQMPLNFRAALSVEAINRRYACSLQVFLGSVRVWSSGHGVHFYTSEVCELELTEFGDLRLKDQNGEIGWRTATSGQGVEKLQLLDSGNLVLADAKEHIKWQTFNFPTNVLLMGQRLSVATHLTSFPTNNPASFFSFEIHHDKLALYLNSGSNNTKYSYWELQPSASRNITFIDLSSRGLDMYDEIFQNFSQLLSPVQEPVRFLALDNSTGNLGFYYYSPYKDMFEVSFQVLNNTCDLPLACSAYGICTLLRTCSCIRLLTSEDNSKDECDRDVTPGLCGKHQVQVLELQDASTSLQSATPITNVSKTECANSCIDDCDCAAALYSSSLGQCMFFDVVRGVKQVKSGSGLSYLVKVPKGTVGKNKKSGLKKWIVVLIVVADGVILFLVLAAVGYFMIWKKRRRTSDCNSSTS